MCSCAQMKVCKFLHEPFISCVTWGVVEKYDEHVLKIHTWSSNISRLHHVYNLWKQFPFVLCFLCIIIIIYVYESAFRLWNYCYSIYCPNTEEKDVECTCKLCHPNKLDHQILCALKYQSLWIASEFCNCFQRSLRLQSFCFCWLSFCSVILRIMNR